MFSYAIWPSYDYSAYVQVIAVQLAHFNIKNFNILNEYENLSLFLNLLHLFLFSYRLGIIHFVIYTDVAFI